MKTKEKIYFMLLLGVLAVFQTIILPGLILITLLRIETKSAIQKWIYTFAISLFTNYAIVTILVLLKIYFQPVIFAIFIFELMIFAYLIYKRRITLNWNFGINGILLFFKGFLNQDSKGKKILAVLSTIIILFYVSLFFSNIGTIFYFVDTVNNIHWNTWSIDLSNNMLPQSSSHFPQLIPSNWSISYLMIGMPNVHFFPKLFMPFFYIGNLLMMFDLALQKKNKVFLVSLIIYGLISPIFYALVFMADGNADLPVSFFTFLSFYAFLNRNTEKFILKEYVLIFLFASTAAATKLSGFYVFLFMSLVCLYQLIKNFKMVSRKELLNLSLIVIGILSINLFWHFVKSNEMVGGLNQPQWLRKTNYLGIFKDAAELIYYNIGLPVVAFLIITILFSLFVKSSKYITMLFVIPPTIIWMLKYSSDFRNLSFVIPFISYVSAFGFIKIGEILWNKKSDLSINVETIKTFNSSKSKVLLYTFSLPIFLLFFYIINTDYVYNILYNIYRYTSMYYFGSNRIVYLIDGTYFINVDYYQKVISVMFLILFFVITLSLINVKIKHIIILFVVSIISLNFTLLDKSQIIQHQRDGFDRVDAHNYYNYVKMFSRDVKVKNAVITNFNAICSERIPREIKFNYKKDMEILYYLRSHKTLPDELIFIQINNIDKELFQFVKTEVENNNYKVLFDNSDYVLINTQPKLL